MGGGPYAYCAEAGAENSQTTATLPATVANNLRMMESPFSLTTPSARLRCTHFPDVRRSRLLGRRPRRRLLKLRRALGLLELQKFLGVLAQDFLLLLVADVAAFFELVHGARIFGIEMRVVGGQEHAILVELLECER